MLTEDGVARAIYTSGGRARQEMSRRISEGIQWYVKHNNPNGAAFAEQNLRGTYKVVEMEVQE